MNSTEIAIFQSLGRPSLIATASRVIASPRFYVYCCCTLLALATAYHLGKEMLWDTLDYHLYAGFSAVHDRFGKDYFAAAPEAYLNPYAYAPFYLLATSGLTALQVALVLAAVQSGVLWLTYELGVAVMPRDQRRSAIMVGACAAFLAYANPVLLNQIGSSFSDITTAELVLGGWLLLIGATRTPSAIRIAIGGLLLGVATALKLTNSLPTVAGVVTLLFVPVGWRARLRLGIIFGVSVAASFLIVSAPWSWRLEEYFGNPLFPLFNGLFKSPQYFAGSVLDYRFLPTSIGDALIRPFAMTLPKSMIHVENAAPDARYAVLLVVAIMLGVRHLWTRLKHVSVPPASADGAAATRALAALGCGFALNWVIWLAVSANSRYFMPMACIAGVLGMALIFRLLKRGTKARNYVLAAIFAAQSFQLHAGTEFHAPLAWGGRPWFDVSVPAPLASRPELYFSVGIEANSFVVPYLAPGSSFINLEGVYNLDATGSNGRRVAALVERYMPNVRVMVRDTRLPQNRKSGVPDLYDVSNALEPFGLKVTRRDCAEIVVHGVTPPEIVMAAGQFAAKAPIDGNDVGYFLTCRVVRDSGKHAILVAGEGTANRALDHLEDACPQLFQPRRPATYVLGTAKHGYFYVRRYSNTDLAAWVSHKWVRYQKLIGGGQEQYVGPESAWAKRPLRVACGRRADGDFLKVLQPQH